MNRHRNLRREVARADPAYQKVLDQCAKELATNKSAFHCERVISATGLQAWGGSIRWDYIIEFLEEPPYNFSLLAVSETFFKEKCWLKQASEATPTLAGRHTATGHGKRTAGYTLARLHGGRLLLYRVEIGAKNAKGRVEAIRDRVKKNITDTAIDQQVREGLTALTGIKPPKTIGQQ